jgi:hypothetical protein
MDRHGGTAEGGSGRRGKATTAGEDDGENDGKLGI